MVNDNLVEMCLKKRLLFLGPPQLSTMLSLNDESFPSTPTSAEMTEHRFYELSHLDGSTQSLAIINDWNDQSFNVFLDAAFDSMGEGSQNENVPLPNNMFDSLSNLLYNLLCKFSQK